MIKNTASQTIGAQMITAADGSAFTSAVTVAVTGDAGTQATGSVGSGACTHEGNGYHTYAPAQGETNYDLIAFTFTGTGAIPATVQVFTRAGDAFTRLGAPAGASVSADIAAIEAQTDDIGAAGAGLTALASAADLATVAGYLDTEITQLLSDTAALLALTDTEVAAILVDTDALETRLTAAMTAKLTAHGLGVLVGVTTTGSTTTAVNLSTVEGATPSAVDDFYNGAVMIFTSGALAGQRTSISDYTGATKIATVVALTGAPANGVTCLIV